MEEFELEGSWWLPETPGDGVPGTLGFSPSSGASLDLLGSLYDPAITSPPFSVDWRGPG